MSSAQAWRKLGKIFGPENGFAWMKSHAQVPTPLSDGKGDFIRIYYSSRPQRSVSLTSFIDVQHSDPTKIVYSHPEPILSLGGPGSFDEHGIMPSCAVQEGGVVYLYYSGWSRSQSVPYTNATGLAISEDGGRTFRKFSAGPIIAKNIYDPYSATSPCVLKSENGWGMWYCSGTSWILVDGKWEHTYDIKYAQSEDGTRWIPSGKVAIRSKTPEEAVTRPWVVAQGGSWSMWYCFRGSRAFRDGANSYRIGYASSSDGIEWTSDDAASSILSPSPGSWDSAMVAYPAIVRTGNSLIMFYNGNDFGASGFGAAVCDASQVFAG